MEGAVSLSSLAQLLEVPAIFDLVPSWLHKRARNSILALRYFLLSFFVFLWAILGEFSLDIFAL